MMECRSDTAPASLSFTVDLGQHLLEMQEEHTILIVDHAQEAEAVRLDGDETYKLLITLQELFK